VALPVAYASSAILVAAVAGRQRHRAPGAAAFITRRPYQGRSITRHITMAGAVSSADEEGTDEGTDEEGTDEDEGDGAGEVSSESSSSPSKNIVGMLPSEAMEGIVDQIMGRIPEEEVSGVSTGWPKLDRCYKVVLGEVTVITGTPGSGKTEWVLSLLMNIASTKGWKFGVCLFEAVPYQVLIQLLEKRHSENHEDLAAKVKAKLANLQFDFLLEHFKAINHSFQTLTADGILARARYLAEVEGIKGLVIDPYNYIDWQTGKDGSRSETTFVSKFLSQLQRFAKDYKVHVWLIAHPTKANQWVNGVPSLYDISGSAHFFNKCDMGIVLCRNRDDKIDCDMRRLDIKVDKCRNSLAGQIGVERLYFDRRIRRYGEEPTPLYFPAQQAALLATKKVVLQLPG